MDIVDIALVVAGVGYILVRRLIGDLVEVKRLLILPAVLTGIGLFSLDDVHVDVVTVGFAAAGVAVSVVLGALRGVSVHLGVRQGELWMRYRAGTVALWVANLAAKGALVAVERLTVGGAADTADSAIMLSLGLGVFAESVVVLLRAMRREGVLVWEKGQAGAPHRPTPAAFDAARARVRAGDANGITLMKGLTTVDRSW